MHAWKNRFAFLAGLLLLVSLAACEALFGEEQVGVSKVTGVAAAPIPGRQLYAITVSYLYDEDDDNFRITCSYPRGDGEQADEYVPDQPSGETTFNVLLKKPGTYSITCRDNFNHSASTQFTMPGEAAAAPEQPPAEQPPAEQPPAAPVAAPADPAAEAAKTPSPADFKTAGMWMYFDQGTSSLAGYSVPQQCLPGVNYTHAGGTSSFDISPDGTLKGDCALSYNEGKHRLTGTMTGFWDEKNNHLEFTVSTQTEYDAETNGKSGRVTNLTTYTYSGPIVFSSPIQMTGTANWQTNCTTTDATVAVCGSNGAATVQANGTVPFVINLNPPPP